MRFLPEAGGPQGFGWGKLAITQGKEEAKLAARLFSPRPLIQRLVQGRDELSHFSWTYKHLSRGPGAVRLEVLSQRIQPREMCFPRFCQLNTEHFTQVQHGRLGHAHPSCLAPRP